jgi:superfamily II DNA or RNA helicase
MRSALHGNWVGLDDQTQSSSQNASTPMSHDAKKRFPTAVQKIRQLRHASPEIRQPKKNTNTTKASYSYQNGNSIDATSRSTTTTSSLQQSSSSLSVSQDFLRQFQTIEKQAVSSSEEKDEAERRPIFDFSLATRKNTDSTQTNRRKRGRNHEENEDEKEYTNDRRTQKNAPEEEEEEEEEKDDSSHHHDKKKRRIVMAQSRTPHRSDWKERMYAYARRHPGFLCSTRDRPKTRKGWVYTTRSSPLCQPPEKPLLTKSMLRTLYWIPESQLPSDYERQTWFQQDMIMQPIGIHKGNTPSRILYSRHYDPPPADEHWVGVPPIYGQCTWGPPTSDCREHGNPLPSEASIDRLRGMDEIQNEGIKSTLRDCHWIGGGVQNFACGSGKTGTGSHVIGHLNRKTLVVVPNDVIMKMWAQDVFTSVTQEDYDAQLTPDMKEKQSQGRAKRPWLFGVKTAVLQGKYEEEKDKPSRKRRQVQQNAHDADIVMTTVQTLYSNMFPTFFLQEFGTVMFDEVHHLNKPKYSQVLELLPMRYRFGMSATPERNDGMSLALYYNVGPLSVFYERTEEMTGLRNQMHVIRLGLTPPSPKYLLSKFVNLYESYKKKMNQGHGSAMSLWSNMGYLMADDPWRRHLVAVLVAYILQSKIREKMVVFTGFVEQSLHLVRVLQKATGEGEVPVLFSFASIKKRWSHIRTLYDNVPESPTQENVGNFQRRMYEQASSTDCRVFVGTDVFLNEGFDCPDIDCVIFASDLKDVKQHLGRAQRPREGKSIPMCIDVYCNFEPWTKRARERLQLYKYQGYHIDDVHVPYMATNDRGLPSIHDSVQETLALMISQHPAIPISHAFEVWKEIEYALHNTQPLEYKE